MQTALNYRVTRFGVPEGLAKDQHAATELGRLYLARRITASERQAGECYLSCYEEAMRAIKAPVGLRKTNETGDGGEVVTDEYIEWAIGAVARWRVFKLASPIVEAVVIEDRPVGHALPELRVWLAYLAKKFGVEAITA